MEHIRDHLIGLRGRAERSNAPMLVYLLDMAIAEADDTARGRPTVMAHAVVTRPLSGGSRRPKKRKD